MNDKRKVTIRRMRRADAPAMARMMRDFAIFHGEKPKATARHFIENCLGNGIYDAWVANLEGRAIGIIASFDRFSFSQAKVMRTISLLFVDGKCRRRGIGRLLIQTVIKDAMGRKCMGINLGAQARNKTANQFYACLGFVSRANHIVYDLNVSQMRILSSEQE